MGGGEEGKRERDEGGIGGWYGRGEERRVGEGR